MKGPGILKTYLYRTIQNQPSHAFFFDQSWIGARVFIGVTTSYVL